jgi:inosine-uridine nucleoside N-ribohydrolase
MTRVLLDVDCGMGIHGADIDDGLEILMALGSDQVEIEGITVAPGNVDLEGAFYSTNTLLRSMKATSIPVGKGLQRPLKRRLVTGHELIRRQIDDYGGVYPAGVDLIDSVLSRIPGGALDAIDLLVESILQSPGEITLIATAPLTNIATAIMRESKFIRSLKEIILMGGVYEAEGNVTPYTEFNFVTDPEAAEVVIQSNAPITLIPLDVTLKTLLSKEDWNSISNDNPWLSQFVVDATTDWLQFLEQSLGQSGCHLHDLLALAAVIDPDVVRRRPADVTVITEDPIKAGQMIVDFDCSLPGGTRVDVVVEHDNHKFMKMVKEALRG